MPKPLDPIYTALGQQQRAQRKAATKLAKLTPKRMAEGAKMYETIKSEPKEG